MPIKSLEYGKLDFETNGKVLGAGQYGKAPITQQFEGKNPLNMEFADGSSLTFRFGLKKLRFTHRQDFYYGIDGTQEVFLQPIHDNLAGIFRHHGYHVKRAGNEMESDWGVRLKTSFSGRSLDRIALEQCQQEGIDTVIIKNAVGELKFVYYNGFLIAIEEKSPASSKKVIYEVGEKGSHYREIDLRVAAGLSQQPDGSPPLSDILMELTEDQRATLQPISEKDLAFEITNRGKVVHLGAMIR
jgi:hypothetical protein